MYESFIEELFCTTEDKPKSIEDEKPELYRESLLSDIVKLLPEENTDLRNRLHNLVNSTIKVHQIDGYRKGLRFAFQLMTEVFNKSPRSYEGWLSDIEKIK